MRDRERSRLRPGEAPGSRVRLNKLLASRGIGARRKCDALIETGAVRVNGTVVKEAGTQVDPERDHVVVHGRPIPGRSALRYLMVHKPVGVITTLDDPEGRPTVRTLLPQGPRLFPVGRLDAETSGLLIATNDGELAHHLMHPRYGVRKVYRVRIDRPADPDQIRRLRSGVEFEPRVMSAPCEVRVRNERAARAEIEIALHEGRYRQVRRMCEAVGLAVKGLHRAAYGPLRIGTLPRGAWRDLTTEEVRRLRAASATAVPRVKVKRPPPRDGARPTPPRGTARPAPPPRAVRSASPRRAVRPSPPRRGARPSPPQRGARPSPPQRGARPSPPRGAVRPSPPRAKGARTATGGRPRPDAGRGRTRPNRGGAPGRRGPARPRSRTRSPKH